MPNLTLINAKNAFVRYHQAHNQERYARIISARMSEFVELCKAQGIESDANVAQRQIRAYLRQTPKRQFPGAWRTRYTLLKQFFHYLVLIGELRPEDNPMVDSPTANSIANKRMLTKAEFQQLLFVIPNTHQGVQDSVCCQLLWHGLGLEKLNELTVDDALKLELVLRNYVQPLLQHRDHLKVRSLFVTINGTSQPVYGQKLNKRLKKYATAAGLQEPERISASLLQQSGAYTRFIGNLKEETL